jgi:hypothetical protein
MEYPVYYEINFDSFKNYVNFMHLTAHELANKASLSMRELAIMKQIVVKEVEEYNECVEYNEYRQIKLARFGVQYVSYFNKKREKLIWLNGFEKDSSFYRLKDDFYFESNVVEVEDGGNGYFETTINLTTGKASGIQIHGSA